MKDHERACSYTAARDVQWAKTFGRCVPKSRTVNQFAIYFDVIQRKVLAPNDFPYLARLQRRLLGFEPYHEETAQPLSWKFTATTSQCPARIPSFGSPRGHDTMRYRISGLQCA